MPRQRILLTGATGFLGARLYRSLLADGHAVTGTTRDQQKTQADVSALDLADSQDLFRALGSRQFDLVVHCAAQQPRAGLSFDDYYQGNVRTLENVLQYMPRWGATRIISFSTVVVYAPRGEEAVSEATTPDPQGLYAISKYTGDCLLRHVAAAQGLAAMCLRMPSLCGAGQAGGVVDTYCDAVRDHRDLEIFSEGRLQRNILHANDVVQAVQRVLRAPVAAPGFHLYLLGSADSLTMADLAGHIVDRLHSRSQIRCVPTPAPVPAHWRVSIEKARRELGFSPMTSREAVDCYLAERGCRDT